MNKFIFAFFLLFPIGMLNAQETHNHVAKDLFEKWNLLQSFQTDKTDCKEVIEAMGEPFLKKQTLGGVVFEYLLFRSSLARSWEIYEINGTRIKKLAAQPVDESVEKILIRFKPQCHFQEFLYFTPDYDFRLEP